jgi:hypothetical protein
MQAVILSQYLGLISNMPSRFLASHRFTIFAGQGALRILRRAFIVTPHSSRGAAQRVEGAFSRLPLEVFKESVLELQRLMTEAGATTRRMREDTGRYEMDATIV